jgi:circadian clock protein KaiC
MEKLGVELATTAKAGRVTTGIKGLDELLHGGLPRGSITMVSGTPGTGKTILCFQFINAGITQGEKCLFLTSDDRITNLLNQAREFGFNFDDAVKAGTLHFLYLNPEKRTLHRELEDELTMNHYDRVVLDSLTPLSEMPIWVISRGTEIIPTDEALTNSPIPIDSIQAMRIHLRRLMNILKSETTTSLVTSEVPEGTRDLSRDTISEFIVDGIFVLDLDPTMDRRKITIRKMRATKHTLKPHTIEIQEHGGMQLLL